MSLIGRLPIWLKFALLATVAIALTGTLIIGASIRELSGDVAKEIRSRQRSNLEIAARTLAERQPGVTIERRNGEIARITLSEWPDFAGAEAPDHTFIDWVGGLTGETATIFAFDPATDDFIRRTTNIIKPSGERAVGTYLGATSAAYAPIMDGTAFLGTAVILGTSYETLYMPIFAEDSSVAATDGGVAGILYVGVEDAALKAQVGELFRALVLIGIGSVVVATLAAAGFSWMLLRPLTTAAQQMRAVADGQSIAVAVTRHDELGEMQKALADLAGTADVAFRQSQVLRQSGQAMITARADDGFRIDTANDAAIRSLDILRGQGAKVPADPVGCPIADLHPQPATLSAVIADPGKLPWVDRVSCGRETAIFTVSALRDRHGNYAGPMLSITSATDAVRTADQFEADVSSLLGKVKEALATLRERTGALERVAHTGSTDSREVFTVSRQSADAIQTMASAVDQLTSSFADVAQRIKQNSQMARSASIATEGATETARALEEAGKRISDVVGLIADVAGQTNLLALNATIEASRAGEAGRGFAVVATEVKNLAERSAKATSDIATEVERVQSAGHALLEAVAKVQGAIREVDEVSVAVSSAVEQQQVAAAEIGQSIHQIASNSARVTRLAENVNENSGQTGEAASAVSSLAADLDDTGNELRTRADNFLAFCRRAA